MATENIVFSVGPERPAAIGYRAMPSGCRGTAATLAEARSSYRRQLCNRLGVERRDLPAVIEHVQARVNGMWVRERVGAIHRDHHADRMLLQAVLAPGEAQEQLRAHVRSAAEQGTEAVVVLVEPDDTVGAVLDQITERDAVILAYSDPDGEIGWTAIDGRKAGGANEIARWAAEPARCVRELGRSRTLGTAASTAS